MFKSFKIWIQKNYHYVMSQRMDPHMMRHFDWPLFIIVVLLTTVGIVSIFAATASPITEMPANVMELLSTQSLTYPMLQLRWFALGLVAMFIIMFFGYKAYGRYSVGLYMLNIAMLLLVLVLQMGGRGGMNAFVRWGSGAERSFQPSELGKVIIIICLAKNFALRDKPISTLKDFMWQTAYVGIPLVLIVLQPDVGTALVYIFIFAVMLFCSKMDWKLIVTLVGALILLMIPVWHFLTMSSDNFRLTRILMWLNPEAYPDEARQIINAQLAIGSGGFFGKGIVSVGSLASLGYISDDHTDMIFSIVCEAFGYVGGGVLISLFLALIIRLFQLSNRVKDPFGSFIILGVAAMFLFHIMENIGMVIGLLPCTGIPLPFISYGGSHMLSVMMAIGLVMNVVMRDKTENRKPRRINATRL